MARSSLKGGARLAPAYFVASGKGPRAGGQGRHQPSSRLGLENTARSRRRVATERVVAMGEERS
jgi:hypothetical protein